MRAALLVIAIVAFAVAAPTASAAQKQKKKPPKPVHVQLLGINDFHGHLDADDGSISRTGDPRLRVPAGGAEYLATQVRRLRRRDPNTLLVAAGDLVGGSPLLSSLFHDEPTIEMMSKLGLYVTSVGNHEFDEGEAELRRLQHGGCHPQDGCRDGSGFSGARFRYLAANIIRKRDGRRFFPPYAVQRIGGVRIGFIGLTTKETPELLAPSSWSGLQFRDEARTANRYAQTLRRQGVRAIVVLLHEGGFPVRAGVGPDACPGLRGRITDIVRRTTRDVDLFLTGHTHAAYNCVIAGRRVTAAGSYGRLITKVDLAIGRRSGEVARVTARNWVVGHDVPRAPDMTALLTHYSRFADPLRNRLVGRMARRAGRARDRSGESKMGNLVADAHRAATGATVAFVNFGIVRAGLPAGNITYGRAFTAQPFGTTLVTMTLTGSQIRELLRQQWCGRDLPNVLQVSAGLSYTWSRAAARAALGRRCEDAPDPIVDLRFNGVPVQPAQAFRVTVNSTLASGGGGGRFFVLPTGIGPVDGPGDVDALAAHLEPTLQGAPLLPPARDRIMLVP